MKGKNNSFEEIWDKLKESRRVLMSLHTGPDGDSLGSCAAMKYVLEREGAEVMLISHDPVDEGLMSLEIAKEVEFGKDVEDFDLKDFDVLVVLDSGNMERVGKQKVDYEIPEGAFVVNIDHHTTNEYYGNLNYVDAVAPSTCSILIKMFKELGLEFDSDLSRRLLLGVCTDSGFFTHDLDLKNIFTDVLFLIENGADYNKEILQPLVLNRPLGIKKYFGLLNANMKFIEDKKLIYSCVSMEEIKDLGLNLAEIRHGSSAISNIKGADFSFTLVEMEDGIKGSFRTTNKVDVSRFAVALGGGGHKVAAGFILKDISLEEAEKKVLDVVEELGVEYF